MVVSPPHPAHGANLIHIRTSGMIYSETNPILYGSDGIEILALIYTDG